MAEYKASPNYSVGDIRFDSSGHYQTEDTAEIKRLDALTPKWVARVDKPEEKELTVPVKEEAKASKPRKSSGK
ncbi:hypothetical protein ACFQ3Y_09070 [Paenibacillus motobuensis]|uniref:hypothetical protein n=1 Tax=Paenibacillus motobuensis TaxID=295324 RepID=UPI00363D067F